MVEKIKSIQNGKKSLMWGSAAVSESETLFAVGHKSSPKQGKFFTVRHFEVTNDYAVSVLEDYTNKRTKVKTCSTVEEVVKAVVDLLKEWFPPKGVTNSDS